MSDQDTTSTKSAGLPVLIRIGIPLLISVVLLGIAIKGHMELGYLGTSQTAVAPDEVPLVTKVAELFAPQDPNAPMRPDEFARTIATAFNIIGGAGLLMLAVCVVSLMLLGRKRD